MEKIARSPSFVRLMAEESIKSFFAREKCVSNGSRHGRTTSEEKLNFHRRGSLIVSNKDRAFPDSSPECKDSRRNSTGKPSPERKEPMKVPHYLRASTGSCHDVCKYGRKHAFEEKEARPWRKGIVRAQPATHNQTEDVSPGRRIKTAVMIKTPTSPARESISLKQKHSPPGKQVNPVPVIIRRKTLLPPMQCKVSPEKLSSLNNKPRVETRMNKFPGNGSLTAPPVVSRASVSTKRTETAGKTTQKFPLKKFASARPYPRESNSTFSPVAQRDVTGRGKRIEGTTARKSMVATNPSAKKVGVIRSASSSPLIPRDATSKGKKIRSWRQKFPVQDKETIKKEAIGNLEVQDIPEKTLHVIVMESNNDIPARSTADGEVLPSPESVCQCQSSPFSYQDDSDSKGLDEETKRCDICLEEEVGDDENGHDCEEEVGDDENGHDCEEVVGVLPDEERLSNDIKSEEGKCSKTLHKGDVDPTPFKMRFRRGRVVDLQHESNGNRRLRFRRGRVVDGNQARKGDVNGRTFKKKGSDEAAHVSKTGDEKVVLRHQDLLDKKDAQGLLNNVIEETASKLVVSRKSKVKALVGAFETVISLQDKTSSQAAS